MVCVHICLEQVGTEVLHDQYAAAILLSGRDGLMEIGLSFYYNYFLLLIYLPSFNLMYKHEQHTYIYFCVSPAHGGILYRYSLYIC